MGNDGRNILDIYGNPDTLVEIRNRLAVLSNNHEIPEHDGRVCFRNAICRFQKPNNLVVLYDFRNMPCYDYLTTLLELYPDCWMKNEFNSESGLCGIWIARMKDNKIDIQSHTWTELSVDESHYYGYKK
jgi:hypothetical protein